MTRAAKYFIAINIACLGVVTWLTSSTWAPSGAEDMSAAGFDVILWVLVALPLAALAFVINAIWTARLVASWRRSATAHAKSELIFLSILGVIWIALWIYDYIHRYRGGL